MSNLDAPSTMNSAMPPLRAAISCGKLISMLIGNTVMMIFEKHINSMITNKKPGDDNEDDEDDEDDKDDDA